MNDELDLPSIGILLADHVVRRTQTHPLSTVAGVAGVGLVLGGGVPNPLLRLGASIALRAITTELIAMASRPAPSAAPASAPENKAPDTKQAGNAAAE